MAKWDLVIKNLGCYSRLLTIPWAKDFSEESRNQIYVVEPSLFRMVKDGLENADLEDGRLSQ